MYIHDIHNDGNSNIENFAIVNVDTNELSYLSHIAIWDYWQF